jgi:hypothetical protein
MVQKVLNVNKAKKPKIENLFDTRIVAANKYFFCRK